MEENLIMEHTQKEGITYGVIVSNPTTKPISVVLFGFNNNFCKPNFGNNKKIELKNQYGHENTYHSLLAQSATKPFKTSKWRIYVASPENVRVINMMEINADSNGCSYSTPLKFRVDPYQFQANILDLDSTIVVDGNKYFTFELPAKTTYTIQMFVSETVSLTRLLRRFVSKIGVHFGTQPTSESLNPTKPWVPSPVAHDKKIEFQSTTAVNWFNPDAQLKNTGFWKKVGDFLFGWMKKPVSVQTTIIDSKVPETEQETKL